jgi:hypothetical protein
MRQTAILGVTLYLILAQTIPIFTPMVAEAAVAIPLLAVEVVEVAA